ncbi:MAG: HAMP domain-containing sensor histidine kinase [Balneolaceae bacterium]|nr:HAMP domain-containing sensor histidine kinase [Balneolaceae bacterium]
MKISLTSNRINIVLICLLILLGIGSYAYNQYVVEQMLEQERSSVELYAKAIEYTSNPVQEEINRNLLKAIDMLKSNPAVSDSVISMIERAESDKTSQTFVTTEILFDEERNNVPTIILDERGEIIYWVNLDEKPDQETIKEFSQMHLPIEIKLGNDEYSQMQYVYYGESPTVQLLRYFPYIQLTLLAILLGVAYISFRTITRSEQSNLWVGMTREAAHQLGTPLSSLYGWVELLKEEKNDDEFTQNICNELESDITRLRGVAERFNKIGSEPELQPMKVDNILDPVIDYMEHRLPQLGKNVDVKRSVNSNAEVNVNPELFQWAVENIIKNAMDAVHSSQNDAYVAIKIHQIEEELAIDIQDSGSGIEKKYHEEVFKPGYSTKKRGWGLGLSLTKRIVEEYHKGRVFVLKSEPGEGTTIRIVLDIAEEGKEKSS